MYTFIPDKLYIFICIIFVAVSSFSEIKYNGPPVTPHAPGETADDTQSGGTIGVVNIVQRTLEEVN